MRTILTLTLLLTALWSAAATAGKCSVCGKRIRGQYLKANSRVFCSQACYEKTLPDCAVCGRRLAGEHLAANGQRYCSQACFQSQLPKCEVCGRPLQKAVIMNGHSFCQKHARGPFCCNCSLPFARGRKLADGRVLCKTCDPLVIEDPSAARRLFLQAKTEVQIATGYVSPTLPPLELVGLDQMPTGSRSPAPGDLVQRGLYKRETETTTTKNVFGKVLDREVIVDEAVRILYALSAEEFLSTASHELTHDLIAEQFPAVPEEAPQWVEEGICQYVAAMVCRRRGFEQELHRIETAAHSEYGDGYRYFKRHCGDDKWPAVIRWLRSTHLKSLPAKAPSH